MSACERPSSVASSSCARRSCSAKCRPSLRNAPDVTALIEDRDTLKAEAKMFHKSAGEALKVVESEATRLGRSVLDMKRYVTGLSSTRMMCKIESAALNGSGDSL